LRKSRTREYPFFAPEHHWDSQIASFDHQSKEEKKPHVMSLHTKKAACSFAQRLYGIGCASHVYATVFYDGRFPSYSPRMFVKKKVFP
jgi:hypothetical protein